MSRDIDQLLEHVAQLSWLPPVHREVVRARLDVPPTREELDAAKACLRERGEY